MRRLANSASQRGERKVPSVDALLDGAERIGIGPLAVTGAGLLPLLLFEGNGTQYRWSW